MHFERGHDQDDESGKKAPDAVTHDPHVGGFIQSARPNYVEIHRENQRRIWDARNAPAKERSRQEARDRMRAHHGKTADTVRPYVRLDGLTPEEKKARKREQDKEARRRYNAKPHPSVALEDDKELEALLADLEPSTRNSMSADEKRESRRLQQKRYRAKKKAQRAAERVGVSKADG